MNTFIFFILSILPSDFQNTEKHALLNRFITMNNSGNEKAVEQFIKESYHPDILQKLDMKKHVAFYQHIMADFPKLNAAIYKTIEESPSRLVVYLIREDESILNDRIDPKDILVVKIDVHEVDNKFLSRGLGLGALVCSIKRD